MTKITNELKTLHPPHPSPIGIILLAWLTECGVRHSLPSCRRKMKTGEAKWEEKYEYHMDFHPQSREWC
jgi:hypothetical protein